MSLPIRATVTLNSIKANYPCQSGWDAFLERFGSLDPDTPVPLLQCLESNPVADVIWALRAVEQDISAVLPLIAADFAESVLPIFEERFPDDKRPRQAIEAARAFTRGEISLETLVKAQRGAAANAASASYASYAAAAYAYAANTASASYADAAYAAAYAANTAANTAAYAAADAVKAAYADAAYAAANTAADAARAAERQKQVEILKRYFTL